GRRRNSSRRARGRGLEPSSRSSRSWGRRGRGAPITALEVELVDVLDREGERRPENHLRPAVWALDDRVLAELAGGERLADLARDAAVGQRGDRVAREVPEILGVPEGERLHRAVVYVLLHLARQPEARQRDLPLVLRVGEVLRGRRDADRRRRLD